MKLTIVVHSHTARKSSSQSEIWLLSPFVYQTTSTLLLKELAARRGLSVNKLVEELSTIAIAEFDAYTRFKAMAASGSQEEGLRLLALLDAMDANEHS